MLGWIVLNAYLGCEGRFSARMVLWDGSWIDARTLHKELKVGKVFANWIKGKIAKYEFIEMKIISFCQNGQKPLNKEAGQQMNTLSLLIWQRNYQW